MTNNPNINYVKLRNIAIFLFAVTFFFLTGFFLSQYLNDFGKTEISESIIKVIQKPYEKYTIENLKNADIKSGVFSEINEAPINNNIISTIFTYSFYPSLDKNIKKTTGIINRPQNQNKNYPIVLLIRGYVDQNIFVSGMGTKNMGEFLASKDFITIAPDFLGYGGSDPESKNIFETRFQTYVTAISLLKTIEENKISGWDGKNLFIWGHSNGGQIALTILEITGKDYPTVLWAPVSKPFPYSVLYYTDESDDHGKFIRSELSKFEYLYDVEKYSLTNYLENIIAPIQLHQGTADDAVPLAWSTLLNSEMKTFDKNISYIKYPGSDHNLRPSWNEAAENSVRFFTENMK